jgi:hypothetical protein
MTRHVGSVALLCLAILGGACAPQKETSAGSQAPVQKDPPAGSQAPVQKEPSTMEMTLDCTMSVAPSQRAGQPVELRFRLSNPTAQPLFVLKWQTPLEGMFGKNLQVTRDGVEVPFQGPMKKRGDPQASDYVTVPPGEPAEATVDVSLAYEMRQPGRYRIAFRNELMDVTAAKEEVPRTLAQLRSLPVQCPAVETTVVAP